MFSFVGDTVLDPFGGTGTTAMAALELGRSSISVEIDPGYLEIAAARLEGSGILGLGGVDVRRESAPALIENAPEKARGAGR